MKTVEIIVDAKGECSVQTKGFAGSSCRDASKAMGIVQSDAPTAEMYQSATTQPRLEQR